MWIVPQSVVVAHFPSNWRRVSETKTEWKVLVLVASMLFMVCIVAFLFNKEVKKCCS